MSKLNQLELLLDIVDLGSLAKAAEYRNLDRSSVSK
ncbi:helix-turn-helix domain-containing protein [Vibrio aestuarianus]|nr:LysR family transcriptional regulator [Vibrio aestuarianus]MDE1239974.1 LysR family transcriptional regulator [Vibrio aestuarianus]